MSAPRILNFLLALATAVVGGGLATWAGLPAAWLSGAMIGVTILTLSGVETRPPPMMVNAIFVLVGMALGVGVTPELIGQAGSWPFSLTMLILAVIAGVVAVRAFLMRVAGWDGNTAFFASLPGALSYVLAIAAETNADMRQVAVSQSIRVFLLVAALPNLIIAIEGGALPQSELEVSSIQGIATVALASLVLAVIMRHLRVPAGLLFGSFLASAILHGTGFVRGGFPEPFVIAIFVLLGLIIGSRFNGTTFRFVLSILLPSAGAFAIVTTISVAAALIVVAATGIPVDQAIIAFAPGGLEAMMSLALALNLDSTYVAVHQFARFAGLAFTLPFVVRWLIKPDGH